MRTLLLPVVLLALAACGTSEPTTSQAEAPAPTASAAAAEARPAYDGRFASDPRLAPADVALIPADRLRTVRNEIYARHGRAFASEDLQAHFGAQPWYEVDPEYDDSRLTDNDKANAALIKSFEAGRTPEGEYSGEPHPTMFVDDHTLMIVQIRGHYEFANPTRHYTSRGDWIITWTGPSTWDPSDPFVEDPELWKLDHAKMAVVERLPIPRG